MLTLDPVVPDGAALDALKAFLRIEGDAEDADLSRFAAAAIVAAEDYAGMQFIRRDARERIPLASTAWQRLGGTPVAAITQVSGIEDGVATPLPTNAYAIDIDSAGDGWVRIIQPGSARVAEVSYAAGLATEWDSLPETLALGILRLAAHFHAHRDRADDAGPPAAVAALLRPWRRMRLA